MIHPEPFVRAAQDKATASSGVNGTKTYRERATQPSTLYCASYRKGSQRIDAYTEGVYEFLHIIPSGKVATYKQVAEYLGNPKLARVVGNILHRNPDGDLNPCYKIVNSKGQLSGSFAFGGETEQANRLRADGIIVENNRVNLARYQFHPS